MTLRSWHALQPFVDRPKRRFGGVVVASLLGGLAEAVVLVLVVRSALVVAGQADQVGDVPLIGANPSVAAALWVALGLAFANLCSHYFVAAMIADLATDITVNLQSRSVQLFLGASWERQALEREGELLENVGSLTNQSASLANSLAVGWSGAANVAALLTVSLLVSPLATAIVLVSGVLIFAALRPMNRLTRRHAKEAQRTQSHMFADLSRVTSLAMELRAFGVSGRAFDRLDHNVTEAGETMRRTRRTSRFGSTLYRDLAVLFLIAAVAALNLFGKGRVASIGAVVLLVVRAANAAQSIQAMRQEEHERGPSFELLLQRFESLEADAEQPGEQRVDSLGVIELHDVVYHYVDTVGLDGVSLRLEPGEVVGIVGPSGGGKTTLAQSLLRLRRPQRGSITVDGVPYEQIHDADWTRLTALVPQEPRLMEASITENIRFLREGIDDDAVERAARSAHVADEILHLPDGFATVLNARGTGLSGGQKQRVAIARALVGQPQLLVLDEPTSALDGVSEQRLQQTIEDLKGTVTMVIIAHRESTLAVCDRIVEVRDGRITAGGAPPN